MPKFNPFVRVDCRYGAPMGRHGDDLSCLYGAHCQGRKLYARHCGGDGYYDRGGAYWGHSDVFAVWTRGGKLCAYVDAANKEQAINKIRSFALPNWMTRRESAQ